MAAAGDELMPSELYHLGGMRIGGIWKHVEVCECIWRCVEVYGGIWEATRSHGRPQEAMGGHGFGNFWVGCYGMPPEAM